MQHVICNTHITARVVPFIQATVDLYTNINFTNVLFFLLVFDHIHLVQRYVNFCMYI